MSGDILGIPERNGSQWPHDLVEGGVPRSGTGFRLPTGWYVPGIREPGPTAEKGEAMVKAVREAFKNSVECEVTNPEEVN